MSMSDVSDTQLLDVISSWGNHGCMTYVAANVLRRSGVQVDTASVLRRLKKLEEKGLVKRVKSSYVTQICWAVTDSKL